MENNQASFILNIKSSPGNEMSIGFKNVSELRAFAMNLVVGPTGKRRGRPPGIVKKKRGRPFGSKTGAKSAE